MKFSVIVLLLLAASLLGSGCTENVSERTKYYTDSREQL